MSVHSARLLASTLSVTLAFSMNVSSRRITPSELLGLSWRSKLLSGSVADRFFG